jgi:hypothetical protein
MNKNIFKILLFAIVVVLIGCDNPAGGNTLKQSELETTTYLIEMGELDPSHSFSVDDLGVFSSPDVLLVPYLITNPANTETGTFSKVEEVMYSVGFIQSVVQRTKTSLTTNSSAFIFYRDINSEYAWIWITEEP